MRTGTWRGILAAIVSLSILAGCGDDPETSGSVFRILSGSENQSLEGIIQEFAKQEDVTVEVTYQGSVDIMRELTRGVDSTYDAVWPANSMWIALGDTTGAVQASASIMRSPVVLGVKRPVAERLGWVGTDVSVDDVLTATEAGQLHFMMANAAQSDSGASAYLGFLYAFAGHPDVLTAADLRQPDVRDKIERILGTVGRTAGSSGFLKDLFLSEYDAYDAMVNYESTVIEANQALVANGRDPLYAIYLVDGTAIADSPFAYIDKDDPEKEATFQGLQRHLLSDEVQRELLGRGRRACLGINCDPSTIDPAVFNPEWGIDTTRILTPVKIPGPAVVREALDLYQTAFRKPSFTVFALDFSGSMGNSGGEDELKAAMRLLLDQESAAQYLLQASPDDVTVVILFNDGLLSEWMLLGNDPARSLQLASQIEQVQADGGTDIYSPVIRGLEIMQERGTDGYFPSVVLMTDGQSRDGKEFKDLDAYVAASGMTQVPVFAITFGKASQEQLDEITALSSGAVFDGRGDLAGAFRAVRGYT